METVARPVVLSVSIAAQEPPFRSVLNREAVPTGRMCKVAPPTPPVSNKAHRLDVLATLVTKPLAIPASKMAPAVIPAEVAV